MTYTLLLFAHILLFAYWLGADLGVYYASAQAVREDLPLEERLRFLKLALLLDMGPRTALVLIFAVGAHLSLALGIFSGPPVWVAAIWAFSLAWLALVWWLHTHESHASRPALVRLDVTIRYGVVVFLLGLAAYSLIQGQPFVAGWVAVKIALYAMCIAMGLVLRGAIARWQQGFALLSEGQTDAGNRIIASVWKRAALQGRLLWALIALVAFFGVWKPTF